MANVLFEVLKDKKVALVGNAQSLLEAPRPEIDDFDVVVRVNKGPLVAKKIKNIGDKTHVNLISAFHGSINKLLPMSKHTVYMSPLKRELLSSEQKSALLFYPIEWWNELYDVIGSRPSTGCMGIDLISRFIGGGELHLFGFDFWRSATSYTGENRPGPHCPESEMSFALDKVGVNNIHGFIKY